jgi:DNA-binding MarR family transcriptional regulator
MVARSSLSRRQKQEEAPSTGDGLTVIQGKEMDTHPQDFDRVIHERTRLGIVSALASNPSLTFSELKTALNSSDGNLSVHARKLEEAGYIASTKSFAGRVPRTTYRLTASGRRALHKYLDHMEALIRAMRER